MEAFADGFIRILQVVFSYESNAHMAFGCFHPAQESLPCREVSFRCIRDAHLAENSLVEPLLVHTDGHLID